MPPFINFSAQIDMADTGVALVFAILLDHWLGEPQGKHPLVFFGKVTSFVESKLNNQKHSALRKKIMGLTALVLMVLPFTLLIYTVDNYININLIFSSVILYFCIAANSLKQHALLVLQALEKDDLQLAKNQVAMIVSRDTSEMTEDEVRKAVIESVLENGADAIFAPIFWFITSGPAGVVLYRLSNTLDAMWGYKNQQFMYFGWATARFDDILNWIPARLTALSYAILGQTGNAIDCWKTQAHLLESPNAGPVMTSGAGSLNLQLGGGAWYQGKYKNKIFFGSCNPPGNRDISRTNLLISQTLLLWIIIILFLDILGYNFA